MKKFSMCKNVWFAFLSLIFLFSFSGCVYLIIGGIGALGGYVVSPDTVEGTTDRDMDSVWEAAHDVIGIMGTIEEEHKEGGIIIGLVSNARVTLTLTNPTTSLVKVTVKARKAFIPKISVAQDVYVKVMSQLGS